MICCLEISAKLPPDLLDSVLSALLPENQKENRGGYDLARNLLMKAADTLNEIINHLIFDALDECQYQTIVKDHVFELVYQLACIDFRFSTKVTNKLEDKLRDADEGNREKLIVLLSRLFSEHRDYYSLHSKLFLGFLGRFIDKDPTIRIKMLHFARDNIDKVPKEISDQICGK
jgi:hypothetical protein